MNKSKYPRIHLTLDNCFALKRWIKPEEWAKVINDEIGGIKCIEASTDLEIDSQFCPPIYRDEWIDSVEKMHEKYGMKVATFYSGYVTYRSAGLLNWDKMYRDTLLGNYVYPTIDMAHKLNANAGSTLHAFTEAMLEDPVKFLEAENMLTEYLTCASKYSAKNNVKYAYEQMYTPTQGWWRIKDVERYLREVQKRAADGLYVTVDTAHMAGHRARTKPNEDVLQKAIKNKDASKLYLPVTIKQKISKGTNYNTVMKDIERYEYWFCDKKDADVYEWLRKLSCYSPAMHLQQTDGTFSSHAPFTDKYNKTGIIDPVKILEAIKESYDQPIDPTMPKRTEDIYMAFELFFGVTSFREDIIDQVKKSVEYFRKVIPEDGLTVDELLK